MKLIKPIKAFCSWPADQRGIHQFLASETKPDIGTATARVLRKTDAAVRQELGRLDLLDGRFHELPELAALVVTDRGTQVLNLDLACARKPPERLRKRR